MEDEFDTASLQKQAEELARTLAEIKELLNPITEAKEALNAERMAIQQTYSEAIKNIKAKEDEVANKQYEVTSQVNQIQQDINSVFYKMQLAEQKKKEAEQAKIAAEQAAIEAEKLAIANKALTESWDMATMRASWREWAKDHQIAAGHKITEDRNVILADPMGLGKTLSVIIAADMIERATKDASEEFPWMGEEEEVYVPEQILWTEEAHKAKEADEDSVLRQYDVVVGKQKQNYLGYDTINRFVERGWLDRIPAHYEKQIVNAVKRPVGRKVLYLCPSSLQKNVMREWALWAKHRNAVFIGGMSRAERDFALMSIKQSNLANYVLICNYEAWRRDKNLIEEFISMNFDMVVIDEAHNAKERKTNVWWGINEILTRNRPEYVVPMTGTPILNRPQELFTLLQMVNPKEFYHQNDFLYTYCEQTDDGKWVFQPGGIERIAKRIGKNFMRRTKDQAGIELPAKTIIKHEIEVDTEAYPLQAKARYQMKKYATIKMENAESKGKTLSAAAVIAMYTRLRQIETWPAGIIQRDPKTKEITFQLDVKESQKIDYIIHKNENGEWDGLIPEGIEDERMVLFSQFKAPLREIHERVQAAGFRAVILDGDTPEAQRDIIAKDFDLRHTPDRTQSQYDIVLCNYKVGGVGLNLTAATQLIVLDEEWNPGKRDQAYDRIHRIGQTKPVTIHMIRNTPTIDNWLGEIMDSKEQMVEGFDNTVTNMGSFKDAMESGLI